MRPLPLYFRGDVYGRDAELAAVLFGPQAKQAAN